MHRPNSDDARAGRPGRVDEFDAIGRMSALFVSAARVRFPEGDLPPGGEVWIGDDAAVLAGGTATPTLLTTDLVVDGVHFDLRLCSIEDVGYKAMMVTASDLAAMGASPDRALASIVAPPGTQLDQLAAGLAAASAECGCVIVGGDLSGGPVVVVSVAVLGGLEPEGIPGPLLRSGAVPGDRLFVTGALGGSAAGHRILLDELSRESGDTGGADRRHRNETDERLVGAFRRPRARIGEGQAARQAGASAATDISDGLVTDIGHLSRASEVGIFLDTVPIVGGATEEEALYGGEDYELVVATPDPDRLADAYRAAGLPSPIPIGWCTDHEDEIALGGEPLSPGGWTHRF